VVAGVATNRILYRDGIPVAIREGASSGEQFLAEVTPDERERLKAALVRGRWLRWSGRISERPVQTRHHGRLVVDEGDRLPDDGAHRRALLRAGK